LKTWTELKDFCEKSERFLDLSEEEKKRYKKEIAVAKRFYSNKRNLFDELQIKKDRIDNRYIIPFLLKLTDCIANKRPAYIQVKSGASGGIDIDTDWQGDGREKIYNYLVEKYGIERVLHVGTFSALGPASAAKDVLRANKIDFGKSNAFTKVLEKQESWEENLERIKGTDQANWRFYEENKEVLEDVPHLIGKIRQCLPWNQDVDIIDEYGVKTKKLIKFIDPAQDYISYMDKDGNKQYTKNYEVFPSGKKKIYEITTSKGKKIRASANHKFFLRSGEIKRLKDLKNDDEIIIDSNSASV